jgi:hypothetical protein
MSELGPTAYHGAVEQFSALGAPPIVERESDRYAMLVLKPGPRYSRRN